MTTKKKTQAQPEGKVGEQAIADLAQMIADIWEHPDCPQELANALNEFTTDLFNRLNEGERRVFMTTPYIRALLLEAKAQEGGE